MGREIERKFLVRGDAWKTHVGTNITQAYLANEIACSVRVRIHGERGFLSVKGAAQGITRAEFEYEIPLNDARELLNLCRSGRIEKIRRKIDVDGTLWEVDEFFGDNIGLVVAEVELESEDQAFAKPAWIGEEVTHDPRYLNSQLADNPFSRWPTRS